jgi:hypothetical protein
MQQLAVVHTEQVSRKGEIKYFQIPMPGTPKKIIGVEASVFLFSGVDVPPVQPGDGLENVPVNASANSNCLNPGKASIELVEETVTAGADGIRTQVYQIGSAVNPGFMYSCGVYSVVLFIPALDDDSPSTIAQKMAAEVNNTTLALWSQYGSNTKNYKPTATAVGDLLTLTVDYLHSFFAIGTGECSGPVAPSVVQYDPLFTVRRNEKAGNLSLQSPDATDIFHQCEVYREDKNLGYGDFTLSGEMVGEWLKGRNRVAADVLITTESPILEAYYKDTWGDYHGKDLNYQLNIIIWYEKQNL